MKVRPPEAAGGKSAPAGPLGPASFSGPSPRTTAAFAAGGKPAMFASGAPGAAALAAAALFLLAPGEARAEAECGISSQRTITCGNAAYNDGIQYFSSPLGHGNGSTLNVPGRSSGPTTITAGSGSQSAGLKLKATTQQGATVNVGGATGGVPHVVNIVQGASTRSGNDEYNNGIYFWSNRLGAWTTLNVRSGVTIGSASAPMEQHGIRFRVRSAQQSQGRGAGAPTLTSAATIYARRQGIRVHRANGATNDATTITNRGAIFSGVGNAADTNTYRHRPHGILAFVPGTTMTGSLTVTNSGDITLGGPYTGIMMQYWASGAMSLDNSGNIGAVAGQTARQGIRFDFEYWENQSAQAVTLTNSGDITASEYGIRLKKLSGGAVTLTNSGAVTATAEAAQHLGHAIYLAEGVTFGEGRTYAANSGAITVDNSGALSSKNHALYVYLATADDDVELENSGAVTSEDGDGIRIERVVEGEVTVDNSGSASGRDYGIYVGKAERVDFDQSGGTIRGRTGVYLQVTSESADGDTRSTDSSMNHIPVIDVDWTGGNVARGTATDDNGRFAAASAAQVLALDQEAAAVKAMEGTLHYGGPAGIEAHALSWRDVVAQVAKGDDPGDFANNAAQLTAVPTGATAADNVYVAQLRAALDNDDLAVASAVLTAIDSTATSLADVTDAEIVTYLRTDNGATRRLLRNILAQGLTDGEKAILRAVATNDGVDAALTAAGHTDDTSDDGDYWSLVKALLDRRHLDDVTIDMTAGSIDSRGDGIRAYYATPNDSNGAIEVTLGAGVSVTADGTGIYVANAGGDVTVESGATIRAGTDGIRVVKPGTSDDVTITTIAGSSITATAGAGIYPQDYASHTGDVTITNAGGVTGGTWGIYANRLGSGAVSVTSSGGTVLGRTEPGIFAANKAGESGDVPVNVTGGAVRSEGRNKAAIHAWNRGTGDVTVTLASGTSARSKHGAGVFADLGSAYSTTSQLEVTQGGAIEGRTGVYARVAHGDDAATPTARAAGAQPMIDVTWTGTFSHGTTATVAQNDNDRFAAGSVAEALAFDQEAAAVKALEGTATYDGPHYGGAAGVDAQALSWRDVVAQVAKGDDPGAIATSTAQGNLLSTTHADSERTAILAQFKAALGNADLAVAAAVLTAIDSTATSVSDLSDAEIVTYLSTDDDATRALLRNVLAQGLSDKEKAVLRAVATNDGLATALADADAAFSTAYKTAVNALLNQYNVGNIEVDMTGGSIAAARGDGIRAWYATPNADNGAITVSVASGASITAGKAGVYAANAGGGVTVSNSGTITAGTYGIYVANTASDGAIEVTVAAGASVTGGTAGVYVANAADGLTLARKYTYGFAMGQGATADQAIAVADSGGTSLLDQYVEVAGTVTGGTDAGVRLSGGAVVVMADGEVRAGSSGVGIKADGAALVYVDGEVWGGAGGAAAVHLAGGGDVTVGLNGRVRANGATNAIQSDGSGTDRLTLITSTTIPYRDDLLAQVDGSLSGIDSARLIEHANGVPTGYSLTLGITSGGMLDTSKLPSRPTSYECAGGRCDITEAGTVASRRTGVYAAVKDSTTVANQPVIDVTWSGTFTQGAVSSTAVRIAAATARDALVADREAAAGKAVEEIVHWGGPAGIEAHALSWRDVATAVAKGDDPGAIADATAQGNLLSTTHADSQRAAILAQLRAALGNADLAVAASVLTAIDSSATSVSDLSDAEIVAYLDDDNEVTRALLRNILAQGLSDKEKAVLEAVAAGDSAALTTALDDTDAGFSAAYKTAVRALLDRRNVRNVRVRMNGGSIVSRGDGIRAYYATPHASNGAIEVTVAAGARVTADRAGVLVANAGGAVTVTSGGTLRGGTYGIHVDKPGTSGAVTITSTGGSITGDTQAGIHVTNAGGAVTVTNRGTVRGGTYGIHVDKTGTSGAVTVTSTGDSITADTLAGIHVANADGAVTVTSGGTITAETYGIHVADAGGAVTVASGGTITADTHGVYVSNASGAVSVTSGGTITADTHGIYVSNAGGAVSITSGGTITADTTADTYGIYVADADGAVTVTNRGTITADTYGIYVDKPGTSGDVTITTTGGSITATATAGIGIYPQDNPGHTGTVTVSNGGDVTAPTYGIYANRLGSGTVSVTNTGGTVLGETEPGIFAANRAGDASDVTVRVTGGTVRSEGRDKPAIHARNWGTGDLTVEVTGGSLRSKHAAGVFATLADVNNNAGQIAVTQGGTIEGRTGVYAQVGRASAADETRAAEDQPLIDVTWTGTFSHGTEADVSQDDMGRFEAPTVAEALSFDQEAATVKAQGGAEGSLRYGAPAGIEAHALSWRDVATAVAKGDDPGAIADATAQGNLLSTTHADSQRAAILAQLRAALGNADLAVAASVLTAIDSSATSVSDLSDAEIVTYLSTDNAATRTLLRNVLAQGLSDDEKSILRAVATNDGVDAALTAAGFTDDTADDSDYWSLVKALLERYNVGNVNVAMNGGSIDSRGDGIRAYYATPHEMNGGISVTVAGSASVTGAGAGVYVANAGEGLRIPKRYAPRAIRALAGNAAAGEDDLIEMGGLNTAGNAIATPWLNQLVTVAGTVTGGTDAAVHLSGGGAVIVMRGGKVHAGSSGVGILADGPAHLFIDGEVKGSAPEEGEDPAPAAVDLPGGGRVIIGRSGSVQANGADNAIRGGGDEETILTLATGPTPYRDVVERQVDGSLEGIEGEVRLSEYQDDGVPVPTGYTGELRRNRDGTLDTSGLDLSPCLDDQPRDAHGECPTPPTDMDGIRIVFTGGGGMVSRDDGIRASYAMPNDLNGGISVTVAEGASVTGAEAGVYVENAGPGLRIPKRYAPAAIRALAGNADAGKDDLIAIGDLNAAGDAIETPWLDQLVTVAGTVTGGTDAAVHLNGGGAVIVEKGGRVLAGSSGVAIRVNDPGPAHLFIDGEVKGATGGAAAVDLPAGGSYIMGLNGKLEANGAALAIRGGTTPETEVDVGYAIASQSREAVAAAHERVEGSSEGVGTETYIEYRDDGGASEPVPMGYTGEVERNSDGTPNLSRFCPEDQTRGPDGECRPPDGPGPGGRPGEGLALTLKCKAVGAQRCRLYEALPSMLLAMNALPAWAERTSAARGANGVWGRVEAARGEWRAKKSTMETPAGKLAYDHRWTAGHAGVDFHAGESGRVGFSVHALAGKAKMGGVGEVELSGMGGGLSATWLFGGLYVDAQAAVTLYDVDMEANGFGKLKKDVHAAGYGLGVDVGRRMSVGGLLVTPRAGMAWSQVDFSGFRDDYEAFEEGPRVRVSGEGARSVKGRVGVMVESEAGMGAASGRLFGSLDVEQEFSDETEVKVGDETLKSEAWPTGVRVGLGGEFDVGEDVVVRATAGYRTSGSGTSGYGGGLEVQVRF